MLCHLSALVLYLGIPFGNVFGPLIVWMIKRAEIPLVDEQGKESLNFQLSVVIYALIISPTFCIFGLGAFLLLALLIAQIILVIIAAVKVNNGENFQYPLTIRFLK